MPDGAVVAFDIGVLLGLSGLDVLDCYLILLSPLSQRLAYVFGAIIDPDRTRFSSPFYDAVQAADDPLGRAAGLS